MQEEVKQLYTAISRIIVKIKEEKGIKYTELCYENEIPMSTYDDIVNASVNQTLARSINTSLTTLITLGALYFFGGVTTKDFVLVMILGIIIGTYSSIFFASTLVALWNDIVEAKRLKAGV